MYPVLPMRVLKPMSTLSRASSQKPKVNRIWQWGRNLNKSRLGYSKGKLLRIMILITIWRIRRDRGRWWRRRGVNKVKRSKTFRNYKTKYLSITTINSRQSQQKSCKIIITKYNCKVHSSKKNIVLAIGASLVYIIHL